MSNPQTDNKQLATIIVHYMYMLEDATKDFERAVIEISELLENTEQQVLFMAAYEDMMKSLLNMVRRVQLDTVVLSNPDQGYTWVDEGDMDEHSV